MNHSKNHKKCSDNIRIKSDKLLEFIYVKNNVILSTWYNFYFAVKKFVLYCEFNFCIGDIFKKNLT